MSVSRQIDYLCPECQARNRALLHIVVDVAHDPELTQQLLDGSLYDRTCAQCGGVTTLDHSTVYVDAGRKAVCWFDAPDGLLDQSSRAAIQDHEAFSDFQLRKVGDLNSLRELARIWYDGLDDAPMLLLKHVLADQVAQERGAPPVLCAFDARIRDETGEHILFATYQTGDSEPEALAVPLDAYCHLLSGLEPVRNRLFTAGEWVRWDAGTARLGWELLRKG